MLACKRRRSTFVRHAHRGRPRRALATSAEHSHKPVTTGGNGTTQHPRRHIASGTDGKHTLSPQSHRRRRTSFRLLGRGCHLPTSSRRIAKVCKERVHCEFP